MHETKRQDFMWFGKGALVETGLAVLEDIKAESIRVLEWLDESQMRENPKHFERCSIAMLQRVLGDSGSVTKEQGYAASDRVGEGLKAVMYLQNHLTYTPKLVSDQRMYGAVDLMLSLQNKFGGFASYELIRGPKWLGTLNPAEVFGAPMNDTTPLTRVCDPDM
ncbi:hypothetical protein APHAL10511_002218 [Amanita phalloides]|nr:hypothetical protein APHAL10511_002218 [Amanita phalloides]